MRKGERERLREKQRGIRREKGERESKREEKRIGKRETERK